MKIEKPSEEYIEKAKRLSKEDAERVFARMRRRYFRLVKEDKFSPAEAVAVQLEYEDEQLQEWRAKMEKLRSVKHDT